MLIQEQIIQLHQQIDSLAEQIRALADQNRKSGNEQSQTGTRQGHLRQINSADTYRRTTNEWPDCGVGYK